MGAFKVSENEKKIIHLKQCELQHFCRLEIACHRIGLFCVSCFFDAYFALSIILK